MQVIKNNTLIYFDVDNTLITFVPEDLEVVGALNLHWDGQVNKILPIGSTVSKIKDFALQGHYVIVHSHKGWEYSKKVVELLKLEDYVTCAQAKALVYIDDEPFHCWTNLQGP